MMHISPSRRRDPAMPQEIAPITVRPSTLNGISEHMVVSHYENNYGNAVRALNAVRRELAALDAGTPPYRLRGLKREELSLMGSVALHELYFGNLGGFRRAGPNSGLGRPDWHEVPDALAAYIDTFFRNINWEAVLKRIEAARNDQPLPNEDPSSTKDMPSVSVEELAAQIANGSGAQIVDARQRDHMSRHVDLMAGATWRDPDRVEEWIAELTPDKPVAVYCSYGFDVGRNVTKTLIERGFDARFVRGGIAAWYASGGARALRPTAG